MNCKPNDLAVVVRTQMGSVRVPDELLGTPVTVLECHTTRYGPMWVLKEPVLWKPKLDALTPNGWVLAGSSYWVALMPDIVLQPMRPSKEGSDTSTHAPERVEVLA